MSGSDVRSKPASRGGGASLQVRAAAADAAEQRLHAAAPVCTSLCLCVSGVDDSESECGLDGGVHFDWIINNDADGPSLEEQLQPLLKLALESAQQVHAGAQTDGTDWERRPGRKD